MRRAPGTSWFWISQALSLFPVDAVGTTRYAYDSVGQLLIEDGPWSADMVSYSYTNRLRSALTLEQPHSGAWTQAYGYDPAKRLASLSSGPGSFTYSYHGGLNGVTAPSDLVKKVLFPTGSYVTNHFDP